MSHKKTSDEKRINESIFLLFTFLFLMSLSSSVLAADPWHSAGVIGANDFEYGNYSFPDSLIVNYSTFLATLGGKR